MIINKLGLHARAAAKLVGTANRFRADIRIERGDQAVNAKSIMGIMMLAASQGTEIDVSADGDDAEAAIIAISELIGDRFGEDE
jgi:phosphocarrier protein